MDLSPILQHCESPIELSLAKAFVRALSDHEQAGMLIMPLEPLDYSPALCLPKGAGAYLVPQAIISDGGDWEYRVDFLFICGFRPAFRRALAIECDGHDWHEKTKEQAARDKLRDRRLLLDGIPTVRFAGSEIHADADACADYVRSLTHYTLGDILGDQHTFDDLRAAKGGAG
jgi:hypothetical protein